MFVFKLEAIKNLHFQLKEVFIRASAIQWLRDGFGYLITLNTVRILLTLTDSGGVKFVPAFTGLGLHIGTRAYEQVFRASKGIQA